MMDLFAAITFSSFIRLDSLEASISALRLRSFSLFSLRFASFNDSFSFLRNSCRSAFESALFLLAELKILSMVPNFFVKRARRLRARVCTTLSGKVLNVMAFSNVRRTRRENSSGESISSLFIIVLMVPRSIGSLITSK